MDVFFSIWSLVILALLFGALLGWAAVRLKVDGNPIVESIEEILPQTQCGQCGYIGCRPYAEAIANGEAINKCPPGGAQGVAALAELLGRDVIPLEEEEKASDVPTVVTIRELECIGCTKCIQACPVDAILGAAKMMHTILTDECTGCNLCIPPCPVDCIDIVTPKITVQNWKMPKPDSLIQVRNI